MRLPATGRIGLLGRDDGVNVALWSLLNFFALCLVQAKIGARVKAYLEEKRIREGLPPKPEVRAISC